MKIGQFEILALDIYILTHSNFNDKVIKRRKKFSENKEASLSTHLFHR